MLPASDTILAIIEAAAFRSLESTPEGSSAQATILRGLRALGWERRALSGTLYRPDSIPVNAPGAYGLQ